MFIAYLYESWINDWCDTRIYSVFDEIDDDVMAEVECKRVLANSFFEWTGH